MDMNPRKKMVHIVGGVLVLVLAGAVGGMIVACVDDHDGRRGDDARMRGPLSMGMGIGREYGMRGGRMGMMSGGMGREGGMPGAGMMDGRPGAMFGGHDGLMRTALRDHLKITDAELKSALSASVDDLLKDGKISKDQASKMKDRLKNAPSMLGSDDDSSGSTTSTTSTTGK